MTAANIIAAATRPAPTSARGVIEARLGRPIGPIAESARLLIGAYLSGYRPDDWPDGRQPPGQDRAFAVVRPRSR